LEVGEIEHDISIVLVVDLDDDAVVVVVVAADNCARSSTTVFLSRVNCSCRLATTSRS
jgi:hypothetical protein